jgi:hypothetical protein
MKRAALASLLSVLASASSHAGPAESAIVAAMKLPDAPNYSWVAEVDDDARSYQIVGKTDRVTDYSLVTMPMVAAVRRRAGRSSSAVDNQASVIFKGDEKFVLETVDGWRKPEELSVGAGGRNARGGFPGGGARGRGGRRGGAGNPFPNEDGSTLPAYSNLQKTLSRPHEEIGIIVAGYTELKAEDGVITGPLNETAAKLLLVHAGQNEITPLAASGTVRLWVSDGVLQKYETRLEGTLAIESGGTRHEVKVRQRTVTTVTGVGTTSFEVPDEARKRLGP